MTTGKLSESAIHNWVGDRSFSRGKNYFRQQAISNPRQQENVLKANCQGSAPYPYHVEAVLYEKGLLTAECSCPVGGGGHCKHVAALLLTWIHHPDIFRQQQSLEAALQAREKEDLILLIQQMVARYPDLEELVEVVPAQSIDAASDANIAGILRQVRQSLSRFDFGHANYHATASMARELSTILHLADAYQERGAWRAAAQITCSILDELVDQFTQIYDHDGDLSIVFWEGSQMLAGCLEHLRHADERQAPLQTLVSIIDLDIKVGGYGFADEAYTVLSGLSTPDEKNEIAAEIETKLATIGTENNLGSDWQRQSYGHWLLDLRAETLSDEQYLDICRRSALHAPLVDRLLAMGRTEEAIVEAQSVSEYALLTLADLFVQYGLGEIAEQLVWERTARSGDTRLDGWLKDYALSRDDWSQALIYAENQFWRRPGIERYDELLSIAEKLGQAAEQYEKVVTRLASAHGQDFGLLVRVYLRHRRTEEALEAFSKIPPTSIVNWAYDDVLAIELAEAAEDTHPRDALSLYQKRVQRLIAARGRDNYARAARLLKRVRSLFERLGERDQWASYMSDIRDQKPRLPALLDELKQAGL